MAQQINVQVYRINKDNMIPRASTRKISFPTAGIIIRSADEDLGGGVWAYGIIQDHIHGTQYYVREAQSTLVTAANA